MESRQPPLLKTGIDWDARHCNRVTRAGNTREDYELASEHGLAEVEAARARCLAAGMTIEEWNDLVDAELDDFNRARRQGARIYVCPKCGAAAGKPCRTATGKRAEEDHAARFEAARIAQVSATPKNSA